MKHIILVLFYAFSFLSFAQEKKPLGIGFRVGDFNGLSAKYYFKKPTVSIETNLGRSFFSGDNYEKRFEHYAEDNRISYVEYDRKRTTELGSIGIRLDIQKYGKIGKTPHLYWYIGTGFQARKFTLEHNYSYQEKAKNSTYTRVNNDGLLSVSHRSFGLDFIIGWEYVFQEVPIAVFVDGLFFYELIGVENNMIAQFGLGARYHF